MKQQIESTFSLPLTKEVKTLSGTRIANVTTLEITAVFYEDDFYSKIEAEERWTADIESVYNEGAYKSPQTNMWAVIEWEAGTLYEMIMNAAQNHAAYLFQENEVA